MAEHCGKFNKELETIKMNQTALNNTVTEIKNTLEGIKSRLDKKEEWMSELEAEYWKSHKLNRKES